MQIRMETERLLLRNLVPDDDAAAFVWCGDSAVNTFMNYPLYERVEDVRKWIESLKPENPDDILAGFVLRESGMLIGSGGLIYNPETDAWNIGYNIRADQWGHGYAVEAVRGLIEYVNKTRPIRTIEGMFALENHQSRRVMEKLGMTYDRDGEYEKIDGSVKFKAKIFRKEYF